MQYKLQQLIQYSTGLWVISDLRSVGEYCSIVTRRPMRGSHNIVIPHCVPKTSTFLFGQPYVLLMYLIIIYFFFNDFSQPFNLGFHWTDFNAVFTIRFRYGCRWSITTSIFECSWDVAMATNFFSEFPFFCRNSKTTQDRHMVPGKENVGKFAFCRMAPSIMTSGDLESQNCFRIILLLRVRFAQKVRDRPLRRFFSSW